MTAAAQATDLDRALSAFRRLVVSVYPAAVYWIVHEYVVAESDGATFSGTPTDPSFSPALPTQVPYAPSLAGSYSVVPAGVLAYVGFANGDPSKPYLVRFGAGVTASSVSLASAPVATSPADAAAERRVVCYGDLVQLGSTAGPMTLTGPTCSKVSA